MKVTDKPIDPATFELKLTKKIKSNERSIAQFRKSSGRIGPILKARFEKNIADLVRKNEMLHQRLKHFKEHKELA